LTPARFADVKAAALLFRVAPGTIHYWVSLYRVPSVPDPMAPKRRLYSLDALDEANTAQAAKRAARNRKAITHG